MVLRKTRYVILGALAALALDLSSKYLALHYLEYLEPKRLAPFFNFVLVMNPGAAFSLFSGESESQGLKMTILALVAMAPLVYFFIKAGKEERLLPAALGTIAGGALGNIHDRLRYNMVVDFLDFHFGNHHWPAFNVADIAICLGVCVLFVSALKNPRGSET
jgi:signal peptidase II